MATIELRGLPELQRKLDRIGASLGHALRPPMQRSLNRMHRDMASYPPQRVGSLYVRTGTYGRRWTTAIVTSSHSIEGRVGNNTEYGPFVGSRRWQAAVHRRRWTTDEDTLEKHKDNIVRDFQTTVNRLLR